MADLKIGETYEDRIYITETATGAPKTGLSPTCTIIDEAGNRSNGTVAEMANGWYKVTDFTPDAAGTWCTEWRLANVGYSVHYPFKMFKVSGGYVKDIYDTLTFQHQTDLQVTQAAPAQNTYYTLLDTTLNVKIKMLTLKVADANETLGLRITADGDVITGGTIAATAGTSYYPTLVPGSWINWTSSPTAICYSAGVFEARSIKIEFRKTTAAGNGTITAWLMYDKR